MVFSLLVFSVDKCPLPAAPRNGSRSQDTFIFGDVITFTCNTGYRLVGENVTGCLAGGVSSGTAPLCQNINECNATAPCSRDALCIDNHGSFGCECLTGYTGNGFSCSGEHVAFADLNTELWKDSTMRKRLHNQ